MDPYLKDVLQIVIIPVSLGLLALVWPAIQSWYRRRNFAHLIVRELNELSPYPKNPIKEGWWEHCRKRFIHREILEDTAANRDFILSLDPDLIYHLAQLWYSLDEKIWDQWSYAMKELNQKHVPGAKLADHRCAWEKLYETYQRKEVHGKDE